jgi:ABC-type nitrate/sulfonate/bicarbonate transport system substrate-binding protein
LLKAPPNRDYEDNQPEGSAMIHLLSLALALFVAVSPVPAAAQMRLAAEIPLSIVNVPMAIAIDRLKQKGAKIEVIEFQSPESMMLALQQGQVDLVGTAKARPACCSCAGLRPPVPTPSRTS